MAYERENEVDEPPENELNAPPEGSATGSSLDERTLPPSVEDGRVEIHGSEVHYLASGSDGPAIVLLHGGGLDSASVAWKHAIEPLAEEYHVFALDWPGHGESEYPEATYSIEYYADVLSSFLDALNVTHTSLVGTGIGGTVALDFALRHPERVDRLVLSASYGLGRDVPGGLSTFGFAYVPGWQRTSYTLRSRIDRALRRALESIVADPTEVLPELLADVHENLERPDAGRAFRRFLRAEVGPRGFRRNYLDRLSELPVPVLFVHGAEDSLVPPERSVRASTLAPDGRISLLEDCGHWPHREQPGPFNALLGSFLSEER